LLGEKTRILGLHRGFRGSGGFPLPFQRPGHSAVFRFARMVLAKGALRSIAGALEPLGPLLLQPVSRNFHVDGHLETELPGGRFQRLQHQAGDQGIQGPPDAGLTQRRAILGGGAPADVAQPRPLVGLQGHHPTTTAATDEEPCEARGPRPDHAASGGGMGGSLPLMARKLLPGNIRGIVILPPDLPGRLGRHAPSGGGAPWLLVPWGGGPPSIDIRPGIHGGVEETAQRVPRRSAPVQLAFGGTGGEPIGELDPMAHTIAEDPADRGLACARLENELEHRLRLLVGSLDHGAGETPERAHGELHAAFPPLRFGPFAREHPLFEDMPFGFRHSPF
jgi:hypothetical protein